MRANRARWPIATMARLLRVSTSGYYAWLVREPSAHACGDAQLLSRIRTLHASSRGTYGAPRIHVQLAREGNRRFPDSPDAPERTSILIHALAGLDHSMEARGEAEAMVNHYPDSEWVREIERFTGAHRHRNVRINDAGVLEYQ